MIGATKFPNSSYASSIDEAQAHVRRCAEPRPAGDIVKAAIRRASRRLDLPFSRTRDIWYGDARRIDADEMDRLSQTATQADLAHAVASVKTLRSKILASSSEGARQIAPQLDSALRAIRRAGARLGEEYSTRPDLRTDGKPE